MAAEEVLLLQLLDSYWFEHQIFTKKPPFSRPAKINPVLEKREEVLEDQPKLPRISTLHIRSFSDQFLSSQESLTSDFLSPNSVLHTPKLQTILSGKEVEEISEPVVKQEDVKKVISDQRRRRKNKGSSKSLSELEFEELKGFMDLGFVFSEEDKNSSLVEIIPGLQRFGGIKVDNTNGGEKEEDKENTAIKEPVASRPYLSQAWDWDLMDQRKAAHEKPLMKWRINTSALGNEMDMKDQLRFWAHSVASAVK